MNRENSSDFLRLKNTFFDQMGRLVNLIGLSFILSPLSLASETEKKPEQKEVVQEAVQNVNTQIPVSYQEVKQETGKPDPRIDSIKTKLAEILVEMGQLLDKTHDDNTEQAVINRLRELNDYYDQLSLELEMTMDNIGLGDPQSEQVKEKQLEPGPELTNKEIDELTHR